MPGDHGQRRQQRHRFQLDHVPAGPGQRAAAACRPDECRRRRQRRSCRACRARRSGRCAHNARRAACRRPAHRDGARRPGDSHGRVSTDRAASCVPSSLRLLPGASLLALRPVDNAAQTWRDRREEADMLETREGGCHCGRVRFRAEVDLDRLSHCSCSICTKKGMLHAGPPRVAEQERVAHLVHERAGLDAGACSRDGACTSPGPPPSRVKSASLQVPRLTKKLSPPLSATPLELGVLGERVAEDRVAERHRLAPRAIFQHVASPLSRSASRAEIAVAGLAGSPSRRSTKSSAAPGPREWS